MKLVGKTIFNGDLVATNVRGIIEIKFAMLIVKLRLE